MNVLYEVLVTTRSLVSKYVLGSLGSGKYGVIVGYKFCVTGIVTVFEITCSELAIDEESSVKNVVK